MKKISCVLGFFICFTSLSSQDVTIYLEGLYNCDPISLDYIVIDNLTQPSSITFTSLPEGVFLYEINLSKGILNSIDGSLNSNPGFSIYAAHFGEIWLNVSVSRQITPTLNLFTLNGTLVQSKTLMVGPETGLIHVKTGNEPIYILQLICEKSAYSFKILGNQFYFSSSIIEAINHPFNHILKNEDNNSSPEFTYSPGDSIRIFSYKGDMYHGEKNFKPANSDTISTYLSMPCPGLFVVYDYDCNAYTTIQLGNQCWLRSNLRTTHYNDGAPLVDGTNAGDFSNDFTTPYWFYPDNNPENDYLFGKLYSGAVIYQYPKTENANLSKEICPPGWHVPSDHEWNLFEALLGMGADTAGSAWRGTNEGGKIKSPINFFFLPPNRGATNESGFDARGAGQRTAHDFGAFKVSNTWWTSTSFGNNFILTRMVNCLNSQIYRGPVLTDTGFSIRCIKN